MNTLLSLIHSQSYFPLKSQGQSMQPILWENDIVYFKKTAFSKIKINDLVVFYKKKQIICHRVIYKTDKYLITKGDNTLSADGKIYPKQILGKVYQIKRNGQFFDSQTLYLIQSTHYFNEIVKIKNEFDREKINYLFLKGLPLHLYFEGEHPKRLYADCDVLVDQKDFNRAQKILYRFGYQKADLHWSKRIKERIKLEIEATFFKTINGFNVAFDIHPHLGELAIVHLGYFNLLYPQSLSDQLVNEFLSNKKTIKINDEKFLILHFELLILYLALHLFHHNFQGSFRFQFFDIVVRKSKLNARNWQKIGETIAKYQLNNFVYPTFYLAKKYYQTPIPDSFLKQIQPVKPLTRKLINKLTLANILTDEARIKAGVNRFLNLFFLSPNPLWKKIFVFFNPQVFYSIFFVIFNQIKGKILLFKLKSTK
jgi:signal peptidase I